MMLCLLFIPSVNFMSHLVAVCDFTTLHFFCTTLLPFFFCVACCPHHPKITTSSLYNQKKIATYSYKKQKGKGQ